MAVMISSYTAKMVSNKGTFIGEVWRIGVGSSLISVPLS